MRGCCPDFTKEDTPTYAVYIDKARMEESLSGGRIKVPPAQDRDELKAFMLRENRNVEDK